MKIKNSSSSSSSNSKTRSKAIAEGYRSGLEERVSKELQDAGIDGEYEQHKITFQQPSKDRKYTPDFWLKGPKGTIIIETKGRFVVADRQKHIYIRDSNPELDIRFVFMNHKAKIRKGSKTTYGDWCNKQGFLYSETKSIPEDWIKEVGL